MAAKSRLYWLDCAPVGRTLPPNINTGCWVPDVTQGTVTASPSCTLSVVGGLRMIVSSLLAVAEGARRVEQVGMKEIKLTTEEEECKNINYVTSLVKERTLALFNCR